MNDKLISIAKQILEGTISGNRDYDTVDNSLDDVSTILDPKSSFGKSVIKKLGPDSKKDLERVATHLKAVNTIWTDIKHELYELER